MNHYPKHIGDWITATAHLNEIEECIYSRCIDLYYSRESPLPLDIDRVCRLVRAKTRDAKIAVETVLKEFFTKHDEGWRQKRCDEELAKYAEKSTKAKSSARSRWEKLELELELQKEQMQKHFDKTASEMVIMLEDNTIAIQKQSEDTEKNHANAMRTHSEINANALQTHCEDTEKNHANAMLTINQEPLTINPLTPKRGMDGFQEFWERYPKKVGRKPAERAWIKAKAEKNIETILCALDHQSKSSQWLNDNGQYIPNPSTWINQHRWNDEIKGENDEFPKFL